LTDESITDKKLSRRQFVGTAAAGAVMLGAVAGATSLAPHATTVGAKARDQADGVKAATPIGAPAQPPIGVIPSSWDYTADVVVVGYGGAGVAAAIGAYDAGASVLILEKAPKGFEGGNSGVAGGSSKIITPLTDFITIVNMMCYGTTPLDVITAFCTETTNLPNWISKLGGTTVMGASSTATSSTNPVGVPPSLYAGFVSPDMSVASMTIGVPAFSYPLKTPGKATGASGSGKDLFAFFDHCRAGRGIPVMYQTPGTQLIQNPSTNEIVGVVAMDWTGQTINVRANKGVILATGGFENSPWFQRQYGPVYPATEYLAFWGSPYNTGDGLNMAMQVGAQLWHMGKKDDTTLSLACKVGSQQIGDALVLSTIGGGVSTTSPVIHVNRNGQRFYNEYRHTGHNDSTLAYDAYVETFVSTSGQNDAQNYSDWPNIPFYAIFDSKAMTAGPLSSSWPTATLYYAPIHNLYQWSPDNSVELAAGWIVTADTPQDLGAKITCRDFYGNVVGMNAAGLAATVTAYNAACAAGVDTQFGRQKASLIPFTGGPYYAMDIVECQTNTDGGPAHDAQERTLDVNNNPIPRLYSPGELGSLWGGLYWGAGNVPEAICMGRVAGVNAAALPSWT
jgi:hypothetical protein